MTQIQKKKKKCRPVLEKKTLQKTFFTSVLTAAREMAKNKGKNIDQMCQLIFLKIYPPQQKQWRKIPRYIYWECQTIYSTSYLKLHNTQLLYLFVDMYILKYFFLKRHDFARSIFAFKKFQEMVTKSLFLIFQNSFSASYFPISQEPLDQNSSLTPLWNNNWKL